MSPTITINELEAFRQRGCRILDVREPEEYRAGHVPGALCLPVGQVPLHASELNRRRPVYVICESGNRSGKVTAYLRARGIDASSVSGGTAAWRSAGRPMQTPGA